MRISDPDKRETLTSMIHNALRRSAKGNEEGPVSLERLKRVGKNASKHVLGALPFAGALMSSNPAEAAAEDLLPPGMEPERLGPEEGTEAYELEQGRIPANLKYENGGLAGANTATSLKPILKNVYAKDIRKDVLKQIRDRKQYKPRKPR